jgi:hypothetical protein
MREIHNISFCYWFGKVLKAVMKETKQFPFVSVAFSYIYLLTLLEQMKQIEEVL